MLCPACNALASLDPLCAKCGANASDEGRTADYYGPYAPYGLSAGQGADLENNGRYCLHTAGCPQCGETFPVAVPLWPL
ncbi:hypothetical protein COLU111180_10970 [Cohnella lubricantis]|uniref:Uncharacterized protein n=1 Tax=Cohnella lubricantis TaxID=2163172 RepID=A0A841T9W9_9BACL|nr:hypothetical protein [Cohnella lubricantis]MBB6678303.1 hypothetical protein [Cohnella lubricantis]MBP2118506.1 rRNA maturation protein Nop10 [Cohnella lubricantis]